MYDKAEILQWINGNPINTQAESFAVSAKAFLLLQHKLSVTNSNQLGCALAEREGNVFPCWMFRCLLRRALDDALISLLFYLTLRQVQL